MELLEIVKLYTEKHKMIFTVFMIQIPICFVVMYRYMEEFPNLDFYTQMMFASATAISVTMFLYLFNISKTVFMYFINREKENPNITFI